MTRRIIITAIILAFVSCGVHAAESEAIQQAVRNIERAMSVANATWDKTIKGNDSNMYMADVYDTESGNVSGPSDVWPYTAAIEAHCALLEALHEIKDYNTDLYNNNFDTYKHRLELLIDNLEYYRGTFTLSSYATTMKLWKPYAVPRASVRGGANVTGILNVYDDQMWLSRELIRAYRITGDEKYLENAAYLADYVIDGWDCWRDSDGKEYGGITWGPGYNSKHACSNAPMIQPLVWLYDEYKDSDAQVEYYYRDGNNSVKHMSRLRKDVYLEFARKIYDWQKEKLLHESGVFWDMMGADNKILVSRGYRQHVDCGNPTGSFFSYNTGTMIAGAAELYRVTSEEQFKDDASSYMKASLTKFSTYVRKHRSYEFNTDDTAENGFATWFNNVLMRSLVGAEALCDNSSATLSLNSFQYNLDYAFENYNRDGLLPIHLLNGWGEEVKTKGFHQFTFAAEYAMLAVRLVKSENSSGVEDVLCSKKKDEYVYNLNGIRLGMKSEIGSALEPGIYVVGNEKILVR